MNLSVDIAVSWHVSGPQSWFLIYNVSFLFLLFLNFFFFWLLVCSIIELCKTDLNLLVQCVPNWPVSLMVLFGLGLIWSELSIIFPDSAHCNLVWSWFRSLQLGSSSSRPSHWWKCKRHPGAFLLSFLLRTWRVGWEGDVNCGRIFFVLLFFFSFHSK